MNMLKTTLNIPPVGPIIFAPSLRAKHLSITINPDRTLRVAVPKGVPLTTARKFLQSKIPWVKKHLDRLQKLRQDYLQTNLPAINKTKAKTFLAIRLNSLALSCAKTIRT